MKRKGKILRNMLLAVVALLLAVIGFMVFSILQRQEPEAAVVETAAAVAETQATEAETEPVVEVTRPVARDYRVVEVTAGAIHTPFGTLHYPEGLSDHLLVVCTCEEPYTLEFCAVMEGRQELRLFDLALGEGSGGNLGLAVTEAGEVPLHVTIYELTTDESWTEGELLTAQAMQDAVNELLQQLTPKTEEAAPQTVMQQQPQEDVTLHNLEFETPYGTLYYPARWTGMVTAEQETTGDGVHRVYFYAQPEKTLLFALYFGGDEAEQVGAIMGPDGIPVTVNLSMGTLASDGEETLFRMQEDANQLIAKLPLLQ